MSPCDRHSRQRKRIQPLVFFIQPPPSLPSLHPFHHRSLPSSSSSIRASSTMSTDINTSFHSQLFSRFRKQDSSQPNPRYVHVHHSLYWALMSTLNRILIYGTQFFMTTRSAVNPFLLAFRAYIMPQIQSACSIITISVKHRTEDCQVNNDIANKQFQHYMQV